MSTAAQIWRAYVTDGVSGSGVHKPIKSQIRAWGTDIESQLIDARFIQRVAATPYVTYSTSSTVGAFGDNKMQNTEGAQILSVAITPQSATNRILIRALVHAAASTTAALQIGLFQDSIAAALSQMTCGVNITDALTPLPLQHDMVAGTIVETTFKIRGAASSGSICFNGIGAGRRGGGAITCTLVVEEYL